MRQSFGNNLYARIGLGGLLLLVVFFGGWWAGKMQKNQSRLTVPFAVDINEMNSGFSFVSPLLFCGDGELSNLTNRASLRIESEVGAYIEEQKRAGKVAEASLYYRDLLEGPWATVNSRMKGTPGSLLKLPFALSLMRYAEEKPGFLEKKIAFEGGDDANAGEYYRAPRQVEAGKDYSVRELYEYMLKYSDNAAALLLVQLVPTAETNDSYAVLGLPDPIAGSDYEMDVRTYSSFLRVLFNASFLSAGDSEYTLKVLSESSFTQGLVAGVPKGTIVSHKFGERAISGSTQLHDCGIVYREGSPYILCVMTRGNDFDDLAATIAGISKRVYGIVDQEDGK